MKCSYSLYCYFRIEYFLIIKFVYRILHFIQSILQLIRIALLYNLPVFTFVPAF